MPGVQETAGMGNRSRPENSYICPSGEQTPSSMSPETNRYFLSLCYDGSPFSGWQVQTGSPTVQGTVEKALGILLGQDVRVTGCGRTDTGVHARSFYAHFDTGLTSGQIRDKHLVYKMNRMLPPEIAIRALIPVAPSTHARFDALSRTYRYQICTRKNPFYAGRAWLMERRPDMQAIREATALLMNYRDFSSFSKSNTQTRTNDCRIIQAGWFTREDLLIFEIRADRFLRNMVRAIVGTLWEVGLGKLDPEGFTRVIEARDRRRAGYSVPGAGLYLHDVCYPEGLLGEEITG